MIKSSPFRSDFGLAGNFDPDEYILNQQGCLRVPAEYCSILMHRDGHAHDPHFPSWIKRQRGSIHRCLASGVIVRFGEKKTHCNEHRGPWALTFSRKARSSRRPLRFPLSKSGLIRSRRRKVKSCEVASCFLHAGADHEGAFVPVVGLAHFRECVLDPAVRTQRDEWCRYHRAAHRDARFRAHQTARSP